MILIISIIFFLLLDYIYLSNTTKHFKDLIYSIQNKNLELKVLPTILCYISLVFGLYYFILKDRRSVLDAFLLGFVIYSVYDTTNKSIFSNWDWFTVFTDSIWGGILFSVTTFLTYKVSDYLKSKK